MEPTYSFHFRAARPAEAAEVLRRAGQTGVVLGADGRWASAVLPRADDERARLRALADHHAPGVLLFATGPAGDRILWQRGDIMLVVDALAARALHRDGLISDVHLARLGAVAPRGVEWISVLGLPAEWAKRSDALLQQPFVDTVGAIAVGVDVGVPRPALRPHTPRTGQELFRMLLDNSAIELTEGASSTALADAFAEQLAFGGAATGAWLMEQPEVEEVYVSDDALQLIIDQAWPAS
jgi:hypothetical protein